jgi:hypothetical protein
LGGVLLKRSLETIHDLDTALSAGEGANLIYGATVEASNIQRAIVVQIVADVNLVFTVESTAHHFFTGFFAITFHNAS